jgi:hypothetical protein
LASSFTVTDGATRQITSRSRTSGIAHSASDKIKVIGCAGAATNP